MEYKAQTITIQDTVNDTGTREVNAYIGVGTGLAYAEVKPGVFTVTHVSSGYRLPQTVATAEEAKRFLENASDIFEDRWNCDISVFKKRFRRHSAIISGKVRAAYEVSLQLPSDEYFLYAATDNDIFTESNTDSVGIDPTNPENQWIAEQLFKDYPEATKVVMVRMDDSGDHHELKTFQRDTVAQA